MDTKVILIENVPLVVPVGYKPPAWLLKDFPRCCGAGDGVGSIVVPETMWGLNVSAACHIHDFSWEVAAASWSDFHQSNSMFLRNIISIIRHKSANHIMRVLRNYRAVTYFNAVDEIGSKVFWGIKR